MNSSTSMVARFERALAALARLTILKLAHSIGDEFYLDRTLDCIRDYNPARHGNVPHVRTRAYRNFFSAGKAFVARSKT